MLDRFYLSLQLKKDKPLDAGYKPSDAIRAIKYTNLESDRLAVIFPGWHTHDFPIDALVKRLEKRGWAVITFDFHDQILEPDEDVVVQSFRYIRDAASQALKEQTSLKPYRKIHFISLSMGGVPMAMVADKFKYFTSATCVVGGDDLAIDMWHGLRTEDYKKQFQKMHIGIRRLAKEWNGIAPDNHLKNFKGKPLKFVMSSTDCFVRTEYQEKLAERLVEAGSDLSVKKRRSGHLLTVLRYCYLDRLP